MLGFFRKYQKYFFVFVTVIIVISFSFFGVINSMAGPKTADPVVHKTPDGTKIRKSELEQMAYFLSTDIQDKKLFGGRRGPNFLNDGVLQKDFLDSGLAQGLAANYKEFLNKDYQARAKKEKYFKLYRHPEADFISVENAWNFIAPDMKRNFNDLQEGNDPLAEKEFKARVQLYLGQRSLTPQILKQVLAYQNKQYSWIPQDPNLPYTDLSLFGYKTIDDWFGPRFVKLAAAFILDVAEIAEKQGITVSDDEAVSDLFKQTRLSYEENKSSPHMDAVNAQDYLKQQLRLMNMDMKQAVNLWKKILLFRRYFDTVGDSIFVDSLLYKNFSDYANMYVQGNLYRLQKDMRLSNFRDLQRFEYYLNAVAKREGNILDLPEHFYTPEQVAEKYPEFVQKRYRLSIASVDTQTLQNEIGTKELWDWQLEDENWEVLNEAFPDLALSQAADREKRFDALSSLNPITREKVDRFSREKILEDNPEKIDQALSQARPEIRIVGMPLGGISSDFEGVKDGKKLISLLDEAFKGKEAADLAKYSQDGRHYYRIEVKGAAEEMDVLTFSELKQTGSLDEKLKNALEGHYEKIREKSPEKFKTPDGDWKSFADARDLVAKDYFSSVLYAVNEKVKSSDPLTVDDAARFRFSALMEHLKKQVQKDPENCRWICRETRQEEGLLPRPPLESQWQLVQSDYKLTRLGQTDEKIDRLQAFSLEPGEWSDIYTPLQGDVSFFQLVKKGIDTDQQLILEGTSQGRDLLSKDAKKLLMEKTLSFIEEKEPIKLEYLR